MVAKKMMKTVFSFLLEGLAGFPSVLSQTPPSGVPGLDDDEFLFEKILKTFSNQKRMF